MKGKIAFCVLAGTMLALLALRAPARAAGPSDATTALVMQGWWGGARAADILFTAGDGGGHWHGRMVIRSAGIVRWLTGVQAELDGHGPATSGAFVPDDYVQHVTSKKSERVVELSFSGAPPLGRRLRDQQIRVDPSAKRDPEAVPDLPEAQRRDTIDPIDGILTIGRRALRGDKNFTLPIYDGRRRYDIAVQVQGPRTVTIDGHPRGVVAAQLVMHPIAGFNRYHLRWWTDAAFSIDLDPATGLPLRIASDSFMVKVVLTTQTMCPPAEGCALPEGK